jgi:succinyl-diaminopimelate desuccinylase
MPLHSALSLAQKLIQCPSVTPEDGGALDFLSALLEEAGFHVERLIFSEEETPSVRNLYARYGKAEPYLLLAGHSDVVPTGDPQLWRHDPFGGVIEDNVLYGRGAVDMKGGLACLIAAALAFIEARPIFKGSIGFLITGDEEGPAINGTRKVLHWMRQNGEHFDHCLLGEPTNPEHLGDMIKIGRRGSLSGALFVQGVQGHVAYPERAQNPIDGLIHLVQALKSTPFDRGTAHFAPSNLEVTSFDVGNPASNVIPVEARARFNIRFNDIWTAASLEVELHKRLEEAASAFPHQPLHFQLTCQPSNAEAFLTEPDAFTALVSKVIQHETGLEPVLSTSGGTSDARFFKDYGKVLEFGLIGQTMHQVNEGVAVTDLERLTRIYARILQDYFD